MVVYKLTTVGNSVGAADRKAAQKRLENSLPTQTADKQEPLTKAEFIRFKNQLQIYFKTLKLKVMIPATDTHSATSMTLAEFCKEYSTFPVDLIAGNYNPNSTQEELDQSEDIILQLDAELDDLVADDIRGIPPPDVDELNEIAGDYMTARIIRALDEDFYFTMHSQRQEMIRVLWKTNWKESETIRQFNQKFRRLMTKCNKLQLLNNNVDKVEVYLHLLETGRDDNPTLGSALNHVPEDHPMPLKDLMKKIAQTIMNRAQDGRLPLDFKSTAMISQPTEIGRAHV